MNDFVLKIRRLGAQVVLGIIIIIVAALALVYFQRQQEQSSLNAQRQQLEASLAKQVTISDTLLEQYNEVLEALPVVPAVDRQAYKEDFILAVTEIATGHPYFLDIGADEFSIEPGDLRIETIGTRSFTVLMFEIIISNVDNNTLLDFIGKIESISEYKTVLIAEADIIWTADTISATIPLEVYTLETS